MRLQLCGGLNTRVDLALRLAMLRLHGRRMVHRLVGRQQRGLYRRLARLRHGVLRPRAEVLNLGLPLG